MFHCKFEHPGKKMLYQDVVKGFCLDSGPPQSVWTPLEKKHACAFTTPLQMTSPIHIFSVSRQIGANVAARLFFPGSQWAENFGSGFFYFARTETTSTGSELLDSWLPVGAPEGQKEGGGGSAGSPPAAERSVEKTSVFRFFTTFDPIQSSFPPNW